MAHDTSRVWTNGRLTVNSHVLFNSSPAFRHWVRYAVATDTGTGRIWPLIRDRAYVPVRPNLPNSSISVPSSSSWCTSGPRSRLPRNCGSGTPPAPIPNVSYCQEKRGEPPAVPYDARSVNAVILGVNHHGSRPTSHAPETRPNVAHR